MLPDSSRTCSTVLSFSLQRSWVTKKGRISGECGGKLSFLDVKMIISDRLDGWSAVMFALCVVGAAVSDPVKGADLV